MHPRRAQVCEPADGVLAPPEQHVKGLGQGKDLSLIEPGNNDKINAIRWQWHETPGEGRITETALLQKGKQGQAFACLESQVGGANRRKRQRIIAYNVRN
jgi:hypothetical protein